MATPITNQAQLTYSSGTTARQASSNIATTNIIGPLDGTKTVLQTAYQTGDHLTYIISLNSSSTAPLTTVTAIDNLGSYITAGGVPVTPLTYVGPTLLYVNGVYSGTVDPTVNTDNIVFTIDSVPAGANVLVVYNVMVNNYALLTAGSDINNTVTVTAAGLSDFLSLTETIPADNYAEVSIVKNMTPNPVTEGSLITYTFNLYNYGNLAATGVTLSDTFNPAPDDITVSVNGTVIPAANYTYTAGTLTLPATGSAYTLSVPAATYTQNATTGAVTTVPGAVTIVVTGTI